jgi:ankyrin repeat protein
MHEKIVRSLARAGADVNAEDDNGDTSLHYAAARGVLNILVILLEANGDPTKANHQGITPAHKAAIYGQTAVIKRLSEAGYNNSILSFADLNGDTPLHFAVRGGYTTTSKLLTSLGADVNKANKQGLTAKALSAQMGMEQLFS